MVILINHLNIPVRGQVSCNHYTVCGWGLVHRHVWAAYVHTHVSIHCMSMYSQFMMPFSLDIRRLTSD